MVRSYGVTAGLVLVAFGLGIYVGHAPRVDAQGKNRILEIRTYTTNDGKLEALTKRMREGESQVFNRLGMKGVLFSVAAEAPQSQNTFVYILAHESREAAKKSWDAFRQDPEWKTLREKSEADGPIVKKADVIFVNPTDFSPIK